jgi:hypothetical protein
VPKHRYAAGLASSSPLFPSCLPRAATCYAAPIFVSSVLSIQKLSKKDRSMAVLAGVGRCHEIWVLARLVSDAKRGYPVPSLRFLPAPFNICMLKLFDSVPSRT